GFEVTSRKAHALVVHTGKVSFSADPSPEASAQGMIPHIQFPCYGRISRAAEINDTLGHGDDVFVGADTVHLWNHVIRKILRWLRRLQSPSRMSISNYTSL